MKFCIYNLTDAPIEALGSSEGVLEGLVLLHPRKSTIISRFQGKSLYLNDRSSSAGVSPESGDGPHLFQVSLPGFWAKRGASWKAVTVVEDCPWRVYWFWPAKALVVLPRRNMASFLADMPDTLSLAALNLPGTHDTMAFYGWPVSQCQSGSTPLSVQFHHGIRVIDIRLAVVPIGLKKKTASPPRSDTLPTPHFKLIAYHGIFPQRTSFTAILSSVHAFLTSPAGSRETIVMSVKQEDFTHHSPTLFSRLVKDEIMNSPGGFKDVDKHGNRDLGMWFLQNRVPNLGEVRGKVVLLSRFGMNGEGWEGGWEGLGIHPLRWPDSEKRGFVWDLKGMTIRTHDWYAIPSFLAIPEKTLLATLVLKPHVPFPLQLPVLPGQMEDCGEKERAAGDVTMLNITYLSAATFPLALPSTVAKGTGWPGFNVGFEGVNARVGRWLLEELVPDMVNFSSAGLPKSEEDGYGAVKQAPNDVEMSVRRRGGMRWLRSEFNKHTKLATKSDSRNDLLERVKLEETGIQSPMIDAGRLRGWALMDFYSSEKALVPLLVEFNYRGRTSGEEGWP